MFELSVAWKYLLPRRRQISVSIISLVSIFVIALVVWLVVLFFSITNGIERHWVSKLIAVTAPIRITPTKAYYDSYYYQVDGISAGADYAQKSIREKLQSPVSDPYNPSADEEIPAAWQHPDRNPDGSLKDPVKEAFAAVNGLASKFPGLRARDYETAFGNIRIRLVRQGNGPQLANDDTQTFMAQTMLFGSLDPNQSALFQTLLPLTNADASNLLFGLGTKASLASDKTVDEGAAPITNLSEPLKVFFQDVKVTSLRAPSGWRLPQRMLPKKGKLKGLALEKEARLAYVMLPGKATDIAALKRELTPPGQTLVPVEIVFGPEGATLAKDGETPQPLSSATPLLLASETDMPARLDEASLDKARKVGDLRFDVSFALQGQPFRTRVRYDQLQIGAFKAASQFDKAPVVAPTWLYRVNNQLVLPTDAQRGEGILLPKGFRDVGGVLVGDSGYISYQIPSVSTMQEQRLPIFVAGFYDPGVIPIGGKFALVNESITAQIRSSNHQDDSPMTNGINVLFPDYRQSDKVKLALEQAFRARGIDRYWKIETFRQFEFTRELLQQLRSDKNMSMVIASVIILVACSNIISMLVILVNDKKLEIGILRSMGASGRSIALIFGLCGVVMGLLGSSIGIGAALLTLRHLDRVLSVIEWFQGYQAFNPTFYGSAMPNELSYEGLAFVLVTTTLISLLAGIIPAIKASLLKPSAILRSE